MSARRPRAGAPQHAVGTHCRPRSAAVDSRPPRGTAEERRREQVQDCRAQAQRRAQRKPRRGPGPGESPQGMTDTISFAEPQFLWLLVAPAVLLVLWVWRLVRPGPDPRGFRGHRPPPGRGTVKPVRG